MTQTVDQAPTLAGSARLAFLLSLVAGTVDVTSFVLLHGVFTAHITGNLVVLAADLGTLRPVEPASVLAIPVFVVVTALLTAVVSLSARPPRDFVRPFLVAQFFLLLLAATIAAYMSSAGSSAGLTTAIVALLAVAAMATQNALLHLCFDRAPSTAVMTGNTVGITVAATRLALGRGTPADQRSRRALVPLLAGFFSGAVLGSSASGLLADHAWFVSVAIAATMVIFPKLAK